MEKVGITMRNNLHSASWIHLITIKIKIVSNHISTGKAITWLEEKLLMECHLNKSKKKTTFNL